MIKEIVATGKDVAEAKENARLALGVSELDDVKFEVLHMGSRGIFGIIGVKPAQVKAYIEIPDREERRHPKERHAKRDNREQRSAEKTTNNEQAVEQKASEQTGAENAPAKNRRKKHKKPAARKNDTVDTSKESKPKSRVIPECELSFERREVAEGEDMSYDFIRTLILDIGLDATAELYSCDDGTRRITIKGKDATALIGHHGDTLDALQYLANLASARKNANGERDKSRVTIDIEGYRAKREETLRALARRMADKALRNKRSVMLEPMSAYERRIIHSEVQLIDGVSTNSIGSDNNRKIVIYLTDKKPQGIFEEDEAKNSKDDEAVADEVVADEVVADEVVADEAVADEAVADEVVADEVVADEAVADEAVADEAVADEAVADRTVNDDNAN